VAQAAQQPFILDQLGWMRDRIRAFLRRGEPL
jgi:hypothetical protein